MRGIGDASLELSCLHRCRPFNVFQNVPRAVETEHRRSVQTYFLRTSFWIVSCAAYWYCWSLDGRWTKRRAQVKGRVQWPGDRWPRSRSRFAGMLLSVLGYTFERDAHASVEGFEQCVREYKSQIPDFVNSWSSNGIEE